MFYPQRLLLILALLPLAPACDSFHVSEGPVLSYGPRASLSAAELTSEPITQAYLVTDESLATFESNGSIVLAGTVNVELAAPLMPSANHMAPYAGEAYPSESETLTAMVDQSFQTYAWLHASCAELNWPLELGELDDPELSPEESFENYQLIAQCAMVEFGAKATMIPQLITDVNICERKLGPGWEVPQASEVSDWNADIGASLDHLLAEAGGALGGVNLYFARTFYVLTEAGDVAVARVNKVGVSIHDLEQQDLRFQVDAKSTDIAGPQSAPALRCVRPQG